MQTLNVANENSTNTLRKDTVEPQQSVSSTQGTNRKIVDPYIHCGFAHSPSTEGIPKPTHRQLTEGRNMQC